MGCVYIRYGEINWKEVRVYYKILAPSVAGMGVVYYTKEIGGLELVDRLLPGYQIFFFASFLLFPPQPKFQITIDQSNLEVKLNVMDDEKVLAQGRIQCFRPTSNVRANQKYLTETSSLNIGDPHGLAPRKDQPSDQQDVSYKPRASRTRGPMVHDISQDFTRAASGVHSTCTSSVGDIAEAACSTEDRRTRQG